MTAGESKGHDAHFFVEKQNITLWPRESPPKAGAPLMLSRCPTVRGAVIFLALVLVVSVVLQALLYSWLQGKLLDVKTNAQLLNGLVGNISALDSEIRTNRGGEEATAFRIWTVNASLNRVLSKMLKMETNVNQTNAQIQLLTARWQEVSTLIYRLSRLRTHLVNATFIFLPLKKEMHELQENLENINKLLKQQNDILQMVSQGWKYFQENFYYFSSSTKTWYSAQQFCLSRDSELTSVTSDNEQEFLYKTAEGIFFWIGLSKVDIDHPWTWVDGTPFNEEQSARYWIPGEPNNMGYKEHCVHLNLYSLRSWNDISCDHALRFICKRPYTLSSA